MVIVATDVDVRDLEIRHLSTNQVGTILHALMTVKCHCENEENRLAAKELYDELMLTANWAVKELV